MSFLETAKDAYELAKKGLTIEFQEKLMELREEALKLQEENLQLRIRLNELETKMKLRQTVHFQAPYYFRDNDPIPFCPICWEKDEKLIHMRSYFGDADGKQYFTCCVCGITHRHTN